MRKVAIIILSLLLLVLIPGAPAHAALPAPGTVLSSTVVTLPADLAARGTARRIEYVTTDVTGARIIATGLILTPNSQLPATKFVVAWAHGTTGLADLCTPSQNRAVFWPEARRAVLELLKKGWTVAAPDYPGLGTTAQHPYLVGDSEGRAIIDSVRAARYLDGSLSKRYALDGHSQGGQGALFAGELAPSYDGDLTLTAVAAIAPASNVQVLADLIPGTPGQGYLVMGVMGLAAVDPTVHPAALFAPPAKEAARQAKLQNGCLYEILEAFDDLTLPDKDGYTDPEDLLINGELPAAVVAKLVARDNPAQRPSSAPILVIQGGLDESVPSFITDMLIYQLKHYQNVPPVEYRFLPDETHDSAVIVSAADVATWIGQRL